MKKLALLLAFVLPFLLVAQNDEPTTKTPNMMEQMQKMQHEMFKNFGMMGDSTEGGMMRMDTTMSKSFGMLFDGEKWQSMMPNDTAMSSMMRQLEERMSKMKDGFDMSDMFKGFSDMFGGGFDMQTSPMPRVKPKEKERKGEEDKKPKSYSTEKI
jgi:hypothetical protein